MHDTKQEKRDAGQDRCRIGGMKERRYVEMNGAERRDAGK